MKPYVLRLAFLLMLTLMLDAGRLPTRAAPISTPVCGVINANTMWSPINSPYTVCIGGVTIGQAATLTIQPGITVQFENAATNRLNVNGALSAIGMPAQPITFTGSVAARGSWGGLVANNTALTPAFVNLSYVTLDYGGVSGSYGAQLYADQALVTITHSIIRNGDNHGGTRPLIASSAKVILLNWRVVAVANGCKHCKSATISAIV